MMRGAFLAAIMLWCWCTFADQSVVDMDFHGLYQVTQAEKQLAAKDYKQAQAAFAKVADSTSDSVLAALAKARAAVALGSQEDHYEEGLTRARAVADRAYSVQARMQLMTARKDFQKLVDTFRDEDIAAWPRRTLPQLPRVGRQDVRALAFFDRGRALLHIGDAPAAVRDIEKAYEFAGDRHHKLNILSFLARGVFERTLKDSDRTFQTDMRIVELDAGYAATLHAKISAAAYLRGKKRYDDALEVLGDWQTMNGRYWFTRGMKAVAGTLADAERYGEAAEAYRLMAEADDERTSSGDRSWAALWAAKMLSAAGENDAARTVYAELLQREEIGNEHRKQAAAALAEMTPPAVAPAEEAGWEHVFTERFDREEIGEQWEILEGTWKIEDGALQGNGVIVTARSFPARDETKLVYPEGFALGYIRMEFDITLLEKLPEGGDSEMAENKMDESGCFINARWPGDANEAKLERGYAFVLGGLYGSRYRVAKPAHRATVAEAEPEEGGAKPGKPCRIVAENDEGVVRLLVDGKPIVEKKEIFSIMGSGFDKVGFEFGQPFRVDNVRVYVKTLPGGLDRDEQRTK